MNVRPLLGLAGVLLSVMASDLNDQVTGVSLPDMRGSLGIGLDAGTWIESLYLSAQPLGMAVSAWFMVTLTLRRWALAVIALIAATSILLPFSPNVGAFYALRILQGLAGGLMTPLLMDTALFVLGPPIRLYGLAAYALTATFVPAMAPTVSAFWSDVVQWKFAFYQSLPLCALGALLVWYGLPPEKPKYGRFKQFDWRAVVLIVVGIGSLTTMLYQGDRLDWFNSRTICVLALISAVGIPLLLVNEWFHPLPFIKLQMLGRRNFAYGVVGLFSFIVIAQASGPLPLRFLTEVDGLRPLQAQTVTLVIAASQLLLLPLMAPLLDRRSVDSRVVSVVGLGLMAAACLGCASVTVYWNREQFYFWQGLQSVGQSMVVMSLLMMATNTVKSEEEAPFASAGINFPRSVAEVVGPWLLDVIEHRRGHFHSDRIVDQVGLDRWRLIQGPGVLPQHPPPLRSDGIPRVPGSLSGFAESVKQQVEILTTSDAYLIFGILTLVVIGIVLILPVRTLPPRILLAGKR
ncbi:MFS transporter [Methylobacterium sp. C1]|uniref:MFS transporter n=1 Tax=Methylobacterium sp. C1 TaxID=1479019 RepID=UPI0008D92144|nr:MFS transporter [Methylobacterium sp. C1]